MVDFIKNYDDAVYVANRILKYEPKTMMNKDEIDRLSKIAARKGKVRKAYSVRKCRKIFQKYFSQGDPFAEGEKIKVAIRKDRQNRKNSGSKASSFKTIRVSEQLHKRLKKLQNDRGEISFDELINDMRRKYVKYHRNRCD